MSAEPSWPFESEADWAVAEQEYRQVGGAAAFCQLSARSRYFAALMYPGELLEVLDLKTISDGLGNYILHVDSPDRWALELVLAIDSWRDIAKWQQVVLPPALELAELVQCGQRSGFTFADSIRDEVLYVYEALDHWWAAAVEQFPILAVLESVVT